MKKNIVRICASQNIFLTHKRFGIGLKKCPTSKIGTIFVNFQNQCFPYDRFNLTSYMRIRWKLCERNHFDHDVIINYATVWLSILFSIFMFKRWWYWGQFLSQITLRISQSHFRSHVTKEYHSKWDLPRSQVKMSKSHLYQVTLTHKCM